VPIDTCAKASANTVAVIRGLSRGNYLRARVVEVDFSIGDYCERACAPSWRGKESGRLVACQFEACFHVARAVSAFLLCI
jgi:hypothetical protein